MKGFSSKTQLNNEFKLTDLAKNLCLNKEEKTELKDIESIVLMHALNAETTGLKASENVELIYIFQLKLKSNQMPMKFIKALDKKTKAHTIFEVMTRDSECLSAEEARTPQLYKYKMWNCRECTENCGVTYTYIMANKKLTDTVSIGDYYQKVEIAERTFLNEFKLVNIEDIYNNMIAYVLELKLRNNENSLALVERKRSIKELELRVEKLERKKSTEVQLNRKIEINDEIRETKKKIEGEML